MKKTIICFDLDNTICKTVNKYSQAKPFNSKIKKLITYMTTDIILKFSLQDIWEDVLRILNAEKKGFLKTKNN